MGMMMVIDGDDDGDGDGDGTWGRLNGIWGCDDEDGKFGCRLSGMQWGVFQIQSCHTVTMRSQ